MYCTEYRDARHPRQLVLANDSLIVARWHEFDAPTTTPRPLHQQVWGHLVYSIDSLDSLDEFFFLLYPLCVIWYVDYSC